MTAVHVVLATTALALNLPSLRPPPSPESISAVTSLSAPPSSRRSFVGTAVAAAAVVTFAEPRAADAAANPNDKIFAPAAGSLSGKTVLITGANTGLGLESAKRLAAGGAQVIVTARTKDKADRAAAAVRAEVGAASVLAVQLDLADLASVRSVPARLEAALGADAPIDVLMNNAGVMAIPERLTTADGYERTIGVNHLGHFALTSALLPALRKAPGGFRIINMSSDAHKLASKENIDAALDANLNVPAYSDLGWGVYGLSKAANVLFTVELNERLAKAGLKGSAVAVHPGLVQTDLPRYVVGGAGAGDTRASETTAPPTGFALSLKEKLLDPFIQPIPKGANTQVYLAAAGDANGSLATKPASVFYDQMQPGQASPPAMDAAAAKRLWEISEKLTGAKMGL